ncbi:MAG: hypothetical protein L0Y71_10035 [Gemmataceae bacterium]|nr:hypothetical protein [Gemmataceae bacterium]
MPNSFSLEELQTWWQELSPEFHSGLRTVGLVLAALVAGHILGKIAARTLRARNFDAVLRLPGSAPTPPAEIDAGITPTFLIGMLVRLTIWAWAGWWFANQYGRVEIAERLGLIISRSWAFAGVLIVILALGSLLANRLVGFLQGGMKPGADAPSLGYGTQPTAAPRHGAADAVAVAVYVLVGLVVLLIAADMFDWPLTRSSAQLLWQLAQKLLTVAATLLIGLLGARWAREMVAEPAATTEKRAGQFTALGMLAISIFLSLGVLLSNANLLLGLAALAFLGVGLWLCRGYLPDISAGLQLRMQHVREVWFDGVPWQVADIGILTSQLCRDGAVHRVHNKAVLDLHVAPRQAPAQ